MPSSLWSRALVALQTRQPAFQLWSKSKSVEIMLAWLMIGAIAGIFAGAVVKDHGFSLFDNSVVGIIGAVLAGPLLPGSDLFSDVYLLGQIISATLGAVGLLIVISIFRRVA